MVLFLAFVQMTVRLVLDVLTTLMFLRAVVSWLPGLSDTRFGEFLYTVTEWVIMPVRSLFDKMNWNAPIMIDVPFFVTFILLTVVSSII